MKRTVIAMIFMALLLLSQTACREKAREVLKTDPITFSKEGELSIFSAGTDSLKATLDIEIADNDYETQTGLMYRDAMRDNQGMLFLFPKESMHSFYMKNTKIPLDIVFVDGNFKIASIRANATPYDETGLSSRVPVQYVLEINAGLAGRWGLQLGDSLSYHKD